jgi:hypothetical protein
MRSRLQRTSTSACASPPNRTGTSTRSGCCPLGRWRLRSPSPYRLLRFPQPYRLRSPLLRSPPSRRLSRLLRRARRRRIRPRSTRLPGPRAGARRRPLRRGRRRLLRLQRRRWSGRLQPHTHRRVSRARWPLQQGPEHRARRGSTPRPQLRESRAPGCRRRRSLPLARHPRLRDGTPSARPRLPRTVSRGRPSTASRSLLAAPRSSTAPSEPGRARRTACRRCRWPRRRCCSCSRPGSPASGAARRRRKARRPLV